MESLLDYETNVVILNSRVQNHVANEDSESDSEFDFATEQWTWVQDGINGEYERIPYGADDITEYDGYTSFDEAFEYCCDGRGNEEYSIDIDDIHNYLTDTGNTLRDFDDIYDLRNSAADYKLKDEYWDNANPILRYWCFCYYKDNYGDYIPNTLRDIIDDIRSRDYDDLQDLEDLITNWMDEHEGIMDYSPDA